MLNVNFAEITAELQSIEPGLDAAEAHGCLCGALCTVGNFSAQRWLQEFILTEHDAVVDAEPVDITAGLEQIFTESQRALNSDAMEFALLLPDDDIALPVRVGAMAQWVQGFLFGFGAGVPTLPGDLSDAVSEVLQDFAQIARADVNEVGDGEEDEDAYTELVEYLRAAVQLVHDELAAQRHAQAQSFLH